MEHELDAPDTTPAWISPPQLNQIIRRLPKGSAPGPSGWTLDHIQAVAPDSEESLDAVHACVSATLKRKLRDWEQGRGSRLIA
jgi:hypothetical protein